MSKVYNALKKAEREGRWQPEQPAADREIASPAPDAGPAREPLDPVAPETALGAAQIPAAALPAPGQMIVERTAEPTDVGLAYDGSSGQQAGGRLADWWRMLTQTDVRPQNDAPALIAGQVPMSRAAEKFQLLRIWFENWTTAQQKRVIMTSSALPGEGKSFVALNLAATLAIAGYRVMLIDADLRRPCLHRSFNLVPLRGLLDYLEGRADFAACLSRVPALPTLTLVAAGGVTMAAAELMADRRMGEFVAQARAFEPPHYVLIDAPAALATPETEILASVVDAALLVVAANHTPRQMVKETYQILKRTTVCGIVLNRFQPPYSTSRKVAYGYYGQAPNQSTSGLY
jgi:capsular exopolysaccharide synthesis family protein